MSLAQVRLIDETGAGLVTIPPRFLAPPESSSEVNVSEQTLQRARSRQSQGGGQSVERTALLGVLLARMEGASFEDVADVLKVKTKRLEKLMHGEENIPKSFTSHWSRLADVLEDLHSVLRPSATGRWLNTPIPDLNNRTPLDAVRRGDIEAVARVAKSYRDPSFH